MTYFFTAIKQEQTDLSPSCFSTFFLFKEKISAGSINHRCYTGLTLQTYLPDQELQKIKHQPSALGFSLGLMIDAKAPISQYC